MRHGLDRSDKLAYLQEDSGFVEELIKVRIWARKGRAHVYHVMTGIA